MLAAMLGSATGAKVAGGAGWRDGEANAVTLSLAGLRRAQAAPEDPQAAALKAMLRKFAVTDANAVAVSEDPMTQQSLQNLFKEMQQSDPDSRQGRSQLDRGGEGAADRAPDAAADRRGREALKEIGEGDTDAASGSLWGQIEPCWKKLGPDSAAPVIITLKLDDRGRIAAPPRIIRPPDARLNRERLGAEVRALQALTTCGPYRTIELGGQRDFRVAFGER